MIDQLKMSGAALLAAIALSGGGAQAATTVFVGDNVLEQQILSPGGTAVFDFVAGETMIVQDFIFQAVGFSGGSDVANLQITLTGALSGTATFPGSSLVINDSTGAGTLTLPDQSVSAGEAFGIQVTDGITNNVGLQVVFTAAPIPVPAGGVLLGTVVVVAGAVAARRKRKAAAAA